MQDMADEPSNVIPIGTAQELEEKKSQNQNKVLFVYGFTSKDYQLPCTIMSKTFRKLSVDTRFIDATAFFEMDVDNFQELAQQYSLDVYPAFLLLNPKDNTTCLSRVIGVNPGKLESSIDEALKHLDPRRQDELRAAQERRRQEELRAAQERRLEELRRIYQRRRRMRRYYYYYY